MTRLLEDGKILLSLFGSNFFHLLFVRWKNRGKKLGSIVEYIIKALGKREANIQWCFGLHKHLLLKIMWL